MNLGEQLTLFVKEARERTLTQDDIVRQVRREFIEATLLDNGCNKCKAARALGRHRNTLDHDIKTLNINVPALRIRAAKKKVGQVREEVQEHGVQVS